MASIKDEANAYVAPETKNIADLEEVSVNMELVEKTYTDSDGKDFTVKTTEIDGTEYRVPVSVLKALKEILTEKPDLQTFKVSKSGSGLSTAYTVIPLD